MNSNNYGPVDTGLGSVSKEMKILLESNVRHEVLIAYKNILFYSRVAARDTLKNRDHLSNITDKVDKILSEEAASGYVIATNYNKYNEMLNYFEFTENYSDDEKKSLFNFFKNGNKSNLLYLLENGYFSIKECVPFLALCHEHPHIISYINRAMPELTDKMIIGQLSGNVIAFEKIVRDILINELERINNQFSENREWFQHHLELIRLEQFINRLHAGLEVDDLPPFSLFISEIAPFLHYKTFEELGKRKLSMPDLLNNPLVTKLIANQLLEYTDLYHIINQGEVHIITQYHLSVFDLVENKILVWSDLAKMQKTQIDLINRIIISPDIVYLAEKLSFLKLVALVSEGVIPLDNFLSMSREQANVLAKALDSHFFHFQILHRLVDWKVAFTLSKQHFINIAQIDHCLAAVKFIQEMGLSEQINFWELSHQQLKVLKSISDLKLLLSKNLITIKQALEFNPLQQKAFREIKSLAADIANGKISLIEVLSWSERDINLWKKTVIQSQHTFFIKENKKEQDINTQYPAESPHSPVNLAL